MNQQMDNQLPEGWLITSLNNLISKDGLIIDGDWVESKDQDESGIVRLIQLADIGDGDFKDKSKRYMNTEAADRLRCTFLKQDDILIARMPDPLGRACIFPGLNQQCVTVVDVCIVRLDKNAAFISRLLKYWINSPLVRNEIAQNATGTTRRRITRKKLEELVLPLPPLAEQHYLADKLDSLLARIQTLSDQLAAVPALLKQFRQSVLADAVSGRLLNRGKNSNGWEEVKFGDVITSSGNGISKRKSDTGMDTTVLRLADFKDAERITGNERQIQLSQKEIEQYVLKENDLLVIRVNGSAELAGKFILYKDMGLPEAYCDHFIRFRIDKNKLLPRYFLYVANSGEGRAYLRSSLLICPRFNGQLSG